MTNLIMMVSTTRIRYILFVCTRVFVQQDVENSHGRRRKNTMWVIVVISSCNVQVSKRRERDRWVRMAVCTRRGPWDRRHENNMKYTTAPGSRTYTTRTAVGLGAVRAQAAVDGGNGQDRLGMLSGPVCLFFIFLSIPRRRRRRCTPYYHVVPPPRTGPTWCRAVTVECTCARACNRRCTHWSFFLRLSRHV